MEKFYRFGSILCSLLVGCLWSCQQKSATIEYRLPEFNEVVTRPLTSVGDTLDDLPSYLEVVGDYIVMQHRSLSNEQLFHVYNRHTGEYVRSFGQQGRAAEELLLPVNYAFSDTAGTAIVAGTLNDNKLLTFRLDSLADNRVSVHSRKLAEPMSFIHFFRLGADHYLGAYGRFRFTLYDARLNPVDTCDYYSETWKGAEPEAMKDYYFYASACEAKPDGTKFMNFTIAGPILEIFDVKDNRIEPAVTRYFAKPVYKESGIPEWDKNVSGARSSCPTDAYIYALWNGTEEEHAKVDKVSVFDWEGRPVKQYVLGENLLRLVIKEELGKGYVVYVDDEFQYRWGSFDL